MYPLLHGTCQLCRASMNVTRRCTKAPNWHFFSLHSAYSFMYLYNLYPLSTLPSPPPFPSPPLPSLSSPPLPPLLSPPSPPLPPPTGVVSWWYDTPVGLCMPLTLERQPPLTRPGTCTTTAEDFKKLYAEWGGVCTYVRMCVCTSDLVSTSVLTACRRMYLCMPAGRWLIVAVFITGFAKGFCK